MVELQGVFDEARGRYHSKNGQRDHRRGVYPNITAGISYGGGQTVSLSSPIPLDGPLMSRSAC